MRESHTLPGVISIVKSGSCKSPWWLVHLTIAVHLQRAGHILCTWTTTELWKPSAVSRTNDPCFPLHTIWQAQSMSIIWSNVWLHWCLYCLFIKSHRFSQASHFNVCLHISRIFKIGMHIIICHIFIHFSGRSRCHPSIDGRRPSTDRLWKPRRHFGGAEVWIWHWFQTSRELTAFFVEFALICRIEEIK